MKKIFFLFISGLTFSVSNAQESVPDAIRYAQDNLTGTARFRAMSGAFGAVGGDLSAISVNPAGSAIFNNNQVGITLSNQNICNTSNYLNNGITQKKDNSFILNQAGGVLVFNDQNPNNNWNKIVIGATYENTNNFDNKVFSMGTNPRNSIDTYFLDYANGIQLKDITDISYKNQFYDEQQANFGYYGYIINPVTDNDSNTRYTSNIPEGGNYYHENEIYSRGYNEKLSFNMATSYKNRIYFGANLNVHITDFRRSTSFYESNNNPLEATETISNLRFNNDIHTYGNGFSFQLGAIAKVTKSLRLGLAYESNTWYELYNEISQNLYSTRQALGGPELYKTVNYNLTIAYDPYTLQTPGKTTLSAAYIFGKSGLISIDYAIKDYGNTKFKPTSDPYFKNINNNISNDLTSNGELRIGAEYKIKRLSLRGGYRFEESPYKNGTTIGDLTSYSGGLGYNFGATKLDLAYSYAERKSNPRFFERGFADSPNITSKLNNVSLTLIFEL